MYFFVKLFGFIFPCFPFLLQTQMQINSSQLTPVAFLRVSSTTDFSLINSPHFFEGLFGPKIICGFNETSIGKPDEIKITFYLMFNHCVAEGTDSYFVFPRLRKLHLGLIRLNHCVAENLQNSVSRSKAPKEFNLNNRGLRRELSRTV